MTPTKIKSSTVYSELLRIRRICSRTEYVDLYDNLLAREYKSRGYSNIQHTITSSKSKILSNFNVDLMKIGPKVHEKVLVYGATCVFDTVYNTHDKIKHIIKDSLDITNLNSICLPMTVPSTKLKRILHTKRRYLSKMRSFYSL